MVTAQGWRSPSKSATAARAWLSERLSGALVAGRLRHSSGARADRMRTELTPQLVAALDTVCLEYLRTQGINDEPLTWSPPTCLIEDLALPGSPPERTDPAHIHELLAAGLDIPEVARKLDASVWAVRYQLEQHPMSAALNIARRRGKRRSRISSPIRDHVAALLPEPVLRDLYEAQGLTVSQIAGRLEITATRSYLITLVSLLADGYGIRSYQRRADRHPKIAAAVRKTTPPTQHRLELDPRVVRLYRALPVAPEQLALLMQRSYTWSRIQRFVEIAAHRNFVTAGQAVGLSTSGVSAFIGTFEADMDHRLVKRANAGRPMALTPYGQLLLRIAVQIDRE